MTAQPTEAVIAGSKGFALALLAPLTERVGTRPRIAADASQALKLTGGSGLVVVEFQGARSLEAIRQLLVQAADVSVIAAVPDGHAGAEEALRSLGVESARWDGNPAEVLSAVSRHLAGAPASAPAASAQASAAPAPPPVPPAPTAASGVGALFDDISLDEAPADAAPGAATPSLLSAPPPSGGAWPSNVPGAVEVADALGRGLQGEFAPAGNPFAVVAEVMASMSPLEKAVLLGEPQPLDVEPIRRAAVMRVRVAVALATAPQGPAAATTDPAAVSALLGELDGLLSDVNALLKGAPAEVQPVLEQVRNGLVKEAIEFSEAAHRAEPSEAAAEPQPKTGYGVAKAQQTRIVAIASKAELQAEKSQQARQGWMYGLLALVAVVAGAYHAYQWTQGRGVDDERVSRTGAPPDATIVAPPTPGVPVAIRSKDGRPLTADEVRRIEQEETLKGNSVRVIGPGDVVVLPGVPLTGRPAPPPTPSGEVKR